MQTHSFSLLPTQIKPKWIYWITFYIDGPLQPYKSHTNNDWTYSLTLKFKSIYNFITYHDQTRRGSYTIPYANYIPTWQWGNLHKEIKWFNNKWPWEISLVKFFKKFIDCTKPIETENCRNLIFADFGPSIAPAANHHPT